jgi:hypothetical protein
LNTLNTACVQNCAADETEVLQRFAIDQTNETSFTIDKVRFCVPQTLNCMTGTNMVVMDQVTKKLASHFVCLKCKDTFHKILEINSEINSIPFDVEGEAITYHRNLQTPYFKCGTVGNKIDSCEYYLDINAGISNFQKSQLPWMLLKHIVLDVPKAMKESMMY